MELISIKEVWSSEALSTLKIIQSDLQRNSNLVDPASSHMLVSKIKPCMSKYKQLCTCETANGSLNQL